VDLATPGMAIEEFWHHRNKDYIKFEYGKLLVLKQVYVKLSWTMKKFHEWYYLVCVYGLHFIKVHIPENIFKTSDFDLHVKLGELHTIYWLRMLDITMMAVWCM
jgi:hypothetical protein